MNAHNLRPHLLLVLTIWETMKLSTTASAWTAEWVDLKTPNSITPKRSGHVAFVNHKDNDNDNVYVFGGYAEDEPSGDVPPNRYPTNDLWKFDHSSGWKLVSAKDAEHSPQQRLAATAASFPNGGNSYVFGGWDSQEAGTGGVILNDICEYDGEKWKTLDTVDLGESTSRLVAVTISEDTILLHNHRSTDHVLLFTVNDDGGKKYAVRQQKTTGTAPSPRGLHAAVHLAESNQLIVFGGAAQDGSMSNEVFALDLSTWIWTPVKIVVGDGEQTSPSPRASPCMCVLDDSTCVLFGGAERSETGLHGCDDLWLLHIHQPQKGGTTITASWERLSTTNRPGGRNAATLTELSSPRPSAIEATTMTTTTTIDEKYFLLSGGWYPFRTTYDDNFVLKMTNNNSKNKQ